jgi:hypothetical protein
MSCLMSLVAGSQVISMFVAGPVAEKIGIPNLYYGSAAMLVGIGDKGLGRARRGLRGIWPFRGTVPYRPVLQELNLLSDFRSAGFPLEPWRTRIERKGDRLPTSSILQTA